MKKLLILVLALILCTALACAEETVYSGSATIPNAWTLGVQSFTTNAGGSFDPSLITEGGSFTVTYTGTSGAVYLAIARWSDNVWAQADGPASTEAQGDGWISTFTWEQLLAAYGTDDFSEANAVCVGSAQSEEPITVTNITWHPAPGAEVAEAPAADDQAVESVTLFRGSMKGSGKDAWMTCIYTVHAGGEWDASAVTEGSAFTVSYKGPENGIKLVLGSISGGKSWAPLTPSATEISESGVRTDTYSWNAIRAAYGTEFDLLDEVVVWSNADSVTLRRIDYLPGGGEPVATGNGAWKVGGSGVAVIGDSIVQNAANFGNWATIIGRSDCDNYGIGGQTTRHCLARIQAVAEKDYETVVFLVGINDIGGIPADETIANIKAMAGAVKEQNADCAFIVISVLPTTPAYYSNMQSKIVTVNEGLQSWAAADVAVTYADCYSLFLGDDGYCKPELVSDGLHPNKAGYDVISTVLKPMLAK